MNAPIAAIDYTPAESAEYAQEQARAAAHRALDAAEKAWYQYAALCDVGAKRIHAFTVYDNVRAARRG